MTVQVRTALGGLVLLALAVMAALPGQAQSFPELTGRVVDQANILSPAMEADLTGKLAAHEASSSNQVVVVTLVSLDGYDIADYGYQLGRHWGIGQEGRNNGVLLLVAPTERKVRIEVGYGLEGDLPDATASSIIQNEILPAFRDGNMPAGVQRGTMAILSAIDGSYEPIPVDSETDPERVFGGFAMLLIFIFIVVQIFRQEARTGFGTRGRRYGEPMGHHGGGFGGGFGGGSGGGFGGGGGGFGGGGSSGGW